MRSLSLEKFSDENNPIKICLAEKQIQNSIDHAPVEGKSDTTQAEEFDVDFTSEFQNMKS